MSQQRRAEPEQPLSRPKTLDRAFILPVLGMALLLPPFAGIFEIDARIAGIPFTVIYLFAVWALLIAGAAVLSRRLTDDEQEPVEPDPGTAPADDA